MDRSVAARFARLAGQICTRDFVEGIQATNLRSPGRLERYVGTSKSVSYLQLNEADLLIPAFTEFGGNYASSRKEPDLCIKPVGMVLPTVVIESGWSESREQLYDDRDL